MIMKSHKKFWSKKPHTRLREGIVGFQLFFYKIPDPTFIVLKKETKKTQQTFHRCSYSRLGDAFIWKVVNLGVGSILSTHWHTKWILFEGHRQGNRQQWWTVFVICCKHTWILKICTCSWIIEIYSSLFSGPSASCLSYHYLTLAWDLWVVPPTTEF